MARICLLTTLGLSLIGAVVANSDGSQAVVVDSPVHTYSSWEYSDCGRPTDVVQIKSIAVSPDPPQPGKNLTVTVKGTVKEEIQDGAYADVIVKMGRVKLLQKRFDVCEEAINANASVTCPVAEDEYEVSQTVELPKDVPQVKVNIDVNGYTVDDEDMVCLKLIVNFGRGFPRLW